MRVANAAQPPPSNPATATFPPGQRWTGRSRGGYFGNWFFVQLIRLFGVRMAYVWLVFVAAYFTVAAPRAYRCSIDYLRRALGPQPFWRWPVLVYRHFFSFGVTLVDRLAVIMGRSAVQCRIEGETQFKTWLDAGKGVILLGAHLGSWEIGGHLLGRLGKPVNVVVLEHEEERLRRLFAEAMQERQFRLLATDPHPLRSVPILAALRRGEIVALLGDRTFGGGEVALSFLGSTARFPTGPFLLAAASGAPIFQVFVVRERIGHYRFVSFPAQVLGRELLRAPAQALEPIVAEYAERLASMARQYPFQWYNYYRFWDETPNRPAPASATATLAPT